MHGDPQILLLQFMCLCLKCIHSKYFKNEITETCYNLKKYNIPLEFSLSKVICPYKYISILKVMSFQGNFKGHVCKKQARRPLIFMFYFYFLS